MAGSTSRNKGANAEREVITILQPIINKCYERFDGSLGDAPLLQRNALQSHTGGFDVVGLDWLALEVKRQETLNLTAWWRQTVKQSGKNRLPVLIYRQSRRPWRVQMPMHVAIGQGKFTCCADISIENFLDYFEQRLMSELNDKMSIFDFSNFNDER